MSYIYRFVMTEFIKKPDEDFGLVKIWYHKETGHLKKKVQYHGTVIVEEHFDKTGLYHREYGLPARIYSDGGEQYYFHGKRHRGHFEPAVIYSNGQKEYWVYGEKRFETAKLK